MEEDVLTYRYGDKLFVLFNGKIIGCHKGKDYYDSQNFDIDMKIEAARLKEHAKTFKGRLDNL